MNKIGFACKWIDNAAQLNGIAADDDCKKYNTGTTTVSWLNRQTRDVAEQRLWDLMKSNIASVQRLVDRVGTLDERRRMVRIGSDILPAYTHSDWNRFWRGTDVRAYAEQAFRAVGDSARKTGVRLSFHPGQFTCIVSENPGIVERSVEELEYHADMARWMGYGKSFQDFKINVHLSGKLGLGGLDAALNQMSPELRNCLTLENDEYQCGLDQMIAVADRVAIVLDVHHHFIKTGQYIQPDDERIKRVVDSWRGVRPVIHYSQSRAEYIGEFKHLASLDEMLTKAKRAKLRAHSDFYDNREINAWALGHLSWADMMSESKGKNLAAQQLLDQYLGPIGI